MIAKLHKLSIPSCSNFYLTFLGKIKEPYTFDETIHFPPIKILSKRACKEWPKGKLSHGTYIDSIS